MSNYENLVETMVEHKTIYEGQVVTVELDTVELINGKKATRDVVRHCGGVAVLPLSEDNMVTLVDQFRYPMGCVIRELPAGKLDGALKTEGHLAGAKRELEEETGLVAESYIYLGHILASPGFCDEVLHMYLARGLTQSEAKPDEDEFLNVVKIPFDTLVEQVMSGEIIDGKTVAAILKTKVYLELEQTKTPY